MTVEAVAGSPSGARAASPPYVAIAVISAAALAYEVLLIRLFSIVQWHHFAHMVISLALLGYGASGAFLALSAEVLQRRFVTVFAVNALLFGVTAVTSFLLVQVLPFNPLELLWDPAQPMWLALVYLVLAVPFFFAANCLGLSFYSFSKLIPRAYGYDLIGAGLGSLGVIALLYVLKPGQLLMVIGASGAVAAALLTAGSSVRRRWAVVGAASVSILVLAGLAGRAVSLQPSPYKGLSHALRVSGAELVEEKSSPLGLLSVVRSPLVPYRHAPGLSLNSTIEPPAQLGVFTDAEALSVITRFDGDISRLAYLGDLTSALPYQILNRPRVLVLGAGGGADVLQGIYHGAGEIDAVEVNPQMVALVRDDYGEYAGRLYDRQEVRVFAQEARGFVAGSERGYDLIQVALLDSFGASSAGLYALSESYLYTVEALQEYVSRLRPGGLLAITRWVKLPPRDGLKLFATAAAALRLSGVEDPERRLAWVRGWSTSTVLVSNGEFSPQAVAAVRQFCTERAFDLVYVPGIRPGEANRRNVLAKPLFFLGAQAVLEHAPAEFLDSYKFDIRPATDDRPYYFNFFRWSSLPELLDLRQQGGMALLDSGYLVLVVTLLQAVAASALLILLPVWIRSRRRISSVPAGTKWRVFFYFMAIGLAFLFVEIAFIQRFVLFLSHPVYAVSVVLAGFLIFAGLGSRYAQREGRSGAWRGLLLAAVTGIAGISLIYLLALAPGLDALMSWHDLPKIMVTLMLIAPLAFLMGLPFPLALTALGDRARDLIPWAWAVNGCASVLAAVLATLLAIQLGFTFVVLSAIVLYAFAAWVVGHSFTDREASIG